MKRSCLSQSSEELLNLGSDWRSATFKAVTKRLRKCLLVSMVGADMPAALGRVSLWAAGDEGLADKATWTQKTPEISSSLRLSKPS